MTIQYLIMQIIYWCIWCSLFSFANSFLSSSGFLPSHIGYIVATGSIFSVITQPITAKLIDEYTNITVKRATVFFFFYYIIIFISINFYK